MKIKFELLSRAITENRKYFMNDIFFITDKLFPSIIKKKKPYNSRHRLKHTMAIYQGREKLPYEKLPGQDENGHKSKVEFKSHKKSIFCKRVAPLVRASGYHSS